MSEPPAEAPRRGADPRPGIPAEAQGSPQLAAEADSGAAPGPTPAFDFWRAIYERRSIRRFKPDPVPRELVTQVLHAGIWAPSSCNYQMWDFVVVDDPATNARLAALSAQMGNAPVNVIVSYGRDFSEDAWANIQSASAAIENMSLAAHVLGLGTFWITQTGDREQVRAIVGLPEDRLVVAVLAIGYPANPPRAGPKRRPLGHVAHWNHYAGQPIPGSPDPERWDPELLAVYQRARVLNGLRHNKPRAFEVEALERALDLLVPAGREPAADPARAPRWLDVLPCTGIVTERLARLRPGFRFDVVERTREVADFVAGRLRPRAQTCGWPRASGGLPAPPEGAYEVVTCLYRLENLRAVDRARLVAEMARWLAPGGTLLVAFVRRGSYHDLMEWARARRGGLGGVEYVLAPDPSIGPFRSLRADEVEREARAAGLVRSGALGLHAAPPRAELDFRLRNAGRRTRALVRCAAGLARGLEFLPGLRAARGRFQFRAYRRG
ncbi:MAG: nitroreductase family protein [Planctomycetes bacterium]|nr:nitroreductase family protein [Planctomycetota bacterium]